MPFIKMMVARDFNFWICHEWNPWFIPWSYFENTPYSTLRVIPSTVQNAGSRSSSTSLRRIWFHGMDHRAGSFPYHGPQHRIWLRRWNKCFKKTKSKKISCYCIFNRSRVQQRWSRSPGYLKNKQDAGGRLVRYNWQYGCSFVCLEQTTPPRFCSNYPVAGGRGAINLAKCFGPASELPVMRALEISTLWASPQYLRIRNRSEKTCFSG